MEALSQLTSLDEDTWRLLLDEIPVGIGIAKPVDPDGTIRPDARITFYNKKWTEMFGFDVRDVETVGEATRRLYPDPELHAKAMQMRNQAMERIRKHGRSEQTEIVAMGADGRWLDLITSTTVVSNRLIMTMLDVSERKRSARELEAKLKTSLNAAALAHEINQPLSAILLDSQMALDRIQGDSRELHQARAFLSSTISNAERTVDTIGKMMSLLRAVQTAHHEVNLVDVVRSAELYAKDALSEGGIAWRTEGTARAVKIHGDEGQLLIAVSNLLRNAIESIKADDRQRPRQILVSLRKDNGSVVLAIGDSGAGLPEKTLAKIPLHTTKPDGTGLGLFIVKSAAENHGAKLEAGSSELGGAEVRLVFPAAN